MTNFIDKIESYALDSSKVAQLYNDSKLTYKELKDNSDALASYIIEKYEDDKTPILIYGHKEHEVLVSFFSCSKAGHAYIPIDITFPSGRVMDIVESSGAKLLINISGIDLGNSNIDILNLQDIIDIFRSYNGKIPDTSYRVKEDENYYILYTSGSTGKPKGVQITKRCIDTFIDWFGKDCSIADDKAIVMNQVSYSFDVSVISVYIGLLMGKTLFVIDKDMVNNFQLLFSAFKRSNIALWITTPAFAEMCLIDESFNSSLLPSLEKMIFAGEVLTKKLLSELYKRFPGVKIINGYGPTEATVLATAVEITEEMMSNDLPIPIGYPIENGKLVVVDENNKELPIGEKGELIIIGESVSPGYFNNKEMTDKHFFDVTDGSKIRRAYRTGDLAYITEDKLIYYCGRKDFQIKLNGYRIEIEDIENNLRKLELINNTVVFPVYNSENKISHLTAFVTLNSQSSEKEFKVAMRIKEYLKKLVPSYMVPRTIKIKDSFPMNTNGKINRKLLMEEL
jgi:D-alanine--poly(phosphoribitol) ligase subunit 1